MIKAMYTAQLLSDWVNIKHGIIYYVNWSEGNCEDYTTEIGKRLLVLPRRIYSKTWWQGCKFFKKTCVKQDRKRSKI